MRHAFYAIDNKEFTDMKKRDIKIRREIPLFGPDIGLLSQYGMKNRPFRPFYGKNGAKTASCIPSFLGLLEAI
jgi:hypothetical protein